MNGEIRLAGSITTLPGEVAGRVIVTGSHGGRLAAALAIRARPRAVIFHDAGIGRDGAGVGGLRDCEATGLAAAAVDHRSACIGDAAHMLEAGIISRANRQAAAAGVRPGQRCAEAARLLAKAAPPADWRPPRIREERERLAASCFRRPVVLADSASLITAEDAGAVVVTGSHGGLVDGNAARAVKAAVFAAVFNDAGMGYRCCGIRRLGVLEEQGIAGLAVDCMSARIGEARSTFEDGIVSAINEGARTCGLRPGMRCREAVMRLARMPL